MKPLKCLVGIHGPLITGLGGMGDATCCLSCGYESYDGWLPGARFRATDVTDASREQLAQLDRARNLPDGINTLAKLPDPEFEKWMKQ